MTLENLKKQCTEQEAAELAILHNARIVCLRAYRDDPTATRKRDLDAATEGLARCRAKLEEKYAGEEPEQVADVATVPEDRFLPNLLEASKWINDLGYKLGKSKLYKDRDKSLIYVWPGGRVYKADAELYARKHLVLGKSVDVSDPALQGLEGLQREKLQNEVARLRKQIDKMEFEMEKEAGKYMLRSDLHREMASRWLVLDQALTQFFRSCAPDLVESVQGSAERIPDFIALVLTKLREELNGYANTEKFNVVVLEQDEEAAIP